MAHFEQEITRKQRGWQVDTHSGIWYVPGDVQAVPDYLAPDAAIRSDDTLIWESLVALLRDYVGDRGFDSIAVCEGYFARLSAPGYLDCTDWECHATIREARASLRDGD